MSFNNATLWNNLQGSNLTDDNRYPRLGVVDMAADSSQYVDYILPSQKTAMSTMSSLRSLEIPAIDEMNPVVLTTPGFEYIPTNLETTAKYSFTRYDVFSGYRHYPSLYANNMADGEQVRNVKMMKIAHKCGQKIEEIILGVLSTQKTQVLGHTTPLSQGDGTFTFSTLTDTLTVNKAAQKETMFANLERLMDANDLPGRYRIVTSRAGLAVQMNEMAKYGAGNDKNLQALGFFDPSRMYESSSIDAGSDVFSGYVVRDGGIGLIPNFPYDFVNGTEIGGKKWSISDMELPFCRMRANIYTNNEATNATALITSGTDTNGIMTHFEEMAIWFSFFVVHRYNSDLTTRANDIVKIVGATS